MRAAMNVVIGTPKMSPIDPIGTRTISVANSSLFRINIIPVSDEAVTKRRSGNATPTYAIASVLMSAPICSRTIACLYFLLTRT